MGVSQKTFRITYDSVGEGKKCDLRHRTSGFKVFRTADTGGLDSAEQYAKRLRAARVRAEDMWNELDKGPEPRFEHDKEDLDGPPWFQQSLNARELRQADQAALATPWWDKGTSPTIFLGSGIATSSR